MGVGGESLLGCRCQSGIFFAFLGSNPEFDPAWGPFSPVSGFWALTVNMRLFEKRGVLNRRGGAFWWSDAARGAGAVGLPG